MSPATSFLLLFENSSSFFEDLFNLFLSSVALGIPIHPALSTDTGETVAVIEDLVDVILSIICNLSRQFEGAFSCSVSWELPLVRRAGLAEYCSVLVQTVDAGGRTIPGFACERNMMNKLVLISHIHCSVPHRYFPLN